MRKKRKYKKNAKYHVIGKANRGERIFANREIKDLLVRTMKRAREKYKFVLHNFCIMSNHFHCIIKPGTGENLSRIMQWILSVFAVKFNKMFGIYGHVWYDRFKSFIIDDIKQFIETFFYITNNPVKTC